MTERRKAVVFPKNQGFLTQLGENILLAYKRRNYTQTLLSERTGLSRATIRKIEQGDPTVSMGHYFELYSQAEGRSPGPLFDVGYYLASNPDLAAVSTSLKLRHS